LAGAAQPQQVTEVFQNQSVVALNPKRRKTLGYGSSA
jgi:hypothetical protein